MKIKAVFSVFSRRGRGGLFIQTYPRESCFVLSMALVL